MIHSFALIMLIDLTDRLNCGYCHMTNYCNKSFIVSVKKC